MKRKVRCYHIMPCCNCCPNLSRWFEKIIQISFEWSSDLNVGALVDSDTPAEFKDDSGSGGRSAAERLQLNRLKSIYTLVTSES
jgi:hypothetical protein